MPCEHLKQLYQVCQSHELKLSSSDLIRIVCPHCGIEEICPSVHTAEYDQRQEVSHRANPAQPARSTDSATS